MEPFIPHNSTAKQTFKDKKKSRFSNSEVVSTIQSTFSSTDQYCSDQKIFMDFFVITVVLKTLNVLI